MRLRTLAATAASLSLVLGSGDANAQLVHPDDKLTGFILHRCPSEIESKPEPVPPAGLPGVPDLIGLGIGYVFDKLGDALARAADVDKNGRATNATVPSYLYRIHTPSADGKPGSFDAPACVAIALADSEARTWCNSEPLKDTEACQGDITLASLITPIVGIAPLTGTAKPNFYAEILLIPSNDSLGVLPKLMALYYPAGLHDTSKFTNAKKKRDLSIAASANTPGGQAALSSVNVILKDLLPQPQLVVRRVTRDKDGVVDTIDPNEVLDQAIVSVWHAVTKAPEKAIGKAGTGAFPVNLSMEVREIGDPNKFLQALAAAFAKNRDSLLGDAKSALIPSVAAAEAATQQQTALAADAEYNTALGVAFAAEAALRKACTTPTTSSPNQGKLEVRQSWSQLASAQATVLRIESIQSRKPGAIYGFDAYRNPFDDALTAKQNCERVPQ